MTTVARVYSDVAMNLGEEVCSELFELQKVFRKEDLDFFSSSLISFEKKCEVLNQIGFSKGTLQFLYQLTSKKRWPFFLSICKECLRVMKEKENCLEGVVESQQELSSQEIKKIEDSLSLFFKNKKVRLHQKQNQSLLGGIRVKIAGLSFNDSILYHFNQFKEQVRNYGAKNSG